MKALIICTNHATYPTKANKTGLWLNELTHTYHVLQKKKILIDIVSPQGGVIPIDERSLDLKDEINHKYYADQAFKEKLTNSLKPADIKAEEYRLIYYAGGHGCLWDFVDNAELQQITRTIYEKGGMIGAVSHGVAGLLNVKLSDGTLLINDKYLTAYSNIEEKLTSFVSEVPFYLEDRLRDQGAHYTKSLIPFIQYIEVDERLITGQNPNSAGKVASKIVEEMFEK